MTKNDLKEFVMWTAREGWVFNWKTEMYEYKTLEWRAISFEQILSMFDARNK